MTRGTTWRASCFPSVGEKEQEKTKRAERLVDSVLSQQPKRMAANPKGHGGEGLWTLNPSKDSGSHKGHLTGSQNPYFLCCLAWLLVWILRRYLMQKTRSAWGLHLSFSSFQSGLWSESGLSRSQNQTPPAGIHGAKHTVPSFFKAIEAKFICI